MKDPDPDPLVPPMGQLQQMSVTDPDHIVPPTEQLQQMSVTHPDTNVPPTEQLPTAPIPAGSIAAADLSVGIEKRKRDGQMKTVRKQLNFVVDNYKSFLFEGDQSELNKISDILDTSDECDWNDAVNVDLMRRVEMIEKNVKKRFDDDKMKGKLITEVGAKLEHEAERRRAEAKEISVLVSEIKTNVLRLEEKKDLIPIEETKKEWVFTNISFIQSTSKYQLSGQRLVEVFSIHTNSPFIKTVSIYDDRCGKIIYRSMDAEIANFFERRDYWMLTHPGRDASEYMEELVVTGPDHAMSAFPGFIIEVDVDDKNGVFDLSCSWKDKIAVDKPMLQSVFTSRGDVHVTSAVMSNAVQASVELFLVFPEIWRPLIRNLDILGELVLCIDKFTVGCKIFQNHAHQSGACLKKSSKRTRFRGMVMMEVPLTREFFVLPVGCCLRLTGNLKLGGSVPILVDHNFKLKDQVGWSTFPVKCYHAQVKFGAICINATSPF